MKRSVLRFLLDIVMMIALILLMDLETVGLTYHERLGIAMGGLFSIHLFQHLPWLRAARAQRQQGPVAWKMGYMWTVSLLLGISCMVTVVTGVLISRTMPFDFPAAHSDGFILLHHSAAYLAVILAGLHIGLHVRALLVRGMKPVPDGFKQLVTRFGQGVVVLMLLAGIRAYTLLDFHSVLAGPFANSSPLLQPASLDSGEAVREGSSHFQHTLDPEEMEDSLSTLVCTGCSRRCPLLLPECQIGLRQRREVTVLIAENADMFQGLTSTDEGSNGWTGVICTGCSYRCPLTRPECIIGIRQLLDAEASATSSASYFAMDAKVLQFPLVLGMFTVGSHYFAGWQDQKRFGRRKKDR